MRTNDDITLARVQDDYKNDVVSVGSARVNQFPSKKKIFFNPEDHHTKLAFESSRLSGVPRVKTSQTHDI